MLFNITLFPIFIVEGTQDGNSELIRTNITKPDYSAEIRVRPKVKRMDTRLDGYTMSGSRTSK